MAVNLYVQIGTYLIKGRIIQSIYFDPDQPIVTVRYLNGRRQLCKLDTQYTSDEIDSILEQINAIHAEPCYPSDSDGTPCPLGMANL